MADASTTLYLLIKPEVGASADTWGSKLNADMDALDKLLGAITTGGSGAAYTLTSGQSLTAYASGQSFLVKASFTCNAAATLNVDGLGAKNITKRGTVATVSGDIVSGNIYRMTYDGTQFQAEGFVPGNFLLPANNLSDLASAATARTNLGLTSAATTAIGTSGATLPLNNAANTFSATNIFSARQRFSASIALDLYNSSGSADGKGWDFSYSSDNLIFGIVNDAYGSRFNIFEVVRSGFSATSFKFTTPVQAPISISAETTGALTSASRNMQVHCSGNITLPASGMTDGDIILIDPRGTARTITRPAAHTMYVADVDSATATTTARSLVLAKFNGSSTWCLSGI